MNINPNVVLAVIIATATIIKETLENEEKQLFQKLNKTLKSNQKNNIKSKDKVMSKMPIMTMEKLKQVAPSIFTMEAHHSVSDRYTYGNL